jgi:DNA-binding transcriptional MocR family regulator
MISARKLAEREQVSLPTALEALRCLEAEGLIVARPRSGYFVCQINTPQNMQSSHHLPGPVPVTMSAVARSIFSSAEARLVPLGAALPDQYGCQQIRYSGRYRLQAVAWKHTGRATAYRREGQTCVEI